MSSWNSNSTPSEIRRQRRLTVARGNLSLTGFTLIETIVALAILSLIFLDMAQIIKIGYSAGSKSKKYVTACSLSRAKIEENSRVPLPADGTVVEDYNAIADFLDFRRETTISNYNATYGAALKQILVTVYWDSGASSVSFITLKADY